jgi:hypothetical protein
MHVTFLFLIKYCINANALVIASSGFVPEYNSSNAQKCVESLFKSMLSMISLHLRASA